MRIAVLGNGVLVYDDSMRIAVLGNGVLGRQLGRYTGATVVDADITDAAALTRALVPLEPELVVNTAAKTGVDWCERNAPEALRVNAIGAGVAAMVSTGIGAHFIQISTDYVFGGYKYEGYSVTDQPYPINVYGASKLYGERVVATLGPEMTTIVRVGWLFGADYPKCAPMLAADTYEEWTRGGVKGKHRAYIWDDIWGTPTHVAEIAMALWTNARIYSTMPQVVHLAPNEAPTTWYQFLKESYPEIRPTQIRNTPLVAARPKRGGLRPTHEFGLGDYSRQLGRFKNELSLTH